MTCFATLRWSRSFTRPGRTLRSFSLMRKSFPNRCLTRRLPRWSAALANRLATRRWCARFATAGVDKTSRFTDWSRRPLTRRAEEIRAGRCDPSAPDLRIPCGQAGRRPSAAAGSQEELKMLTSPDTYVTAPQRRLETGQDADQLAQVSWPSCANLRPFARICAKARNIPRNRVYKDDALVELASRTSRQIMKNWAARGCYCAKRARARSPTGSSRRSRRDRRASLTICRTQTGAATSCR